MAKRHYNHKGNLPSLFLHMEELVLANSGEDEFEEVFKLLIAKLWDECSQQSKFRRYDTDATTFETIVQLLRQAAGNWPGVLDDVMPKLTPEHLSICVDAIAEHDLSNESFDAIDDFFEFIVSKSAKGVKGQYFTPRYVIELCVRLLKPSASEMVLDPACGSGGFLLHTLGFVKGNENLNSPEKIRNFCSQKLWGFDIDSRATRVAKALMVVCGDGGGNIIRINSLFKPEMMGLFDNSDDPKMTIEDVCRSRMKLYQGFDIILTNPPFAGEIKEKNFLNCYSLARKKSRVERDVLFIERCLELLKPGGRLAMILPHNKLAGHSFGFLRKWILKKARIVAVIGLGRNTFLPHTHQKSGILILQKQFADMDLLSDYNIFFAVSEKDGKNSKGEPILRPSHLKIADAWNRIDHDFSEIIDSFEKFRDDETIGFGQ